ncbi:unnamed protein product [Sphagnum balticum]
MSQPISSDSFVDASSRHTMAITLLTVFIATVAFAVILAGPDPDPFIDGPHEAWSESVAEDHYDEERRDPCGFQTDD